MMRTSPPTPASNDPPLLSPVPESAPSTTSTATPVLQSAPPPSQPRLRKLASKPLRLAGSIARGFSSPARTASEDRESGSGKGKNGNGGKNGNRRAGMKPEEGEVPVGRLRVRVVKCEGLAAKDKNGSSDPFLTLLLPPSARSQTPVIKHSLSPDFTASPAIAEKSVFEFPLYKGMAVEGGMGGRGLEVLVWDKDLISKDYLGEVSVPVSAWFAGEAQIWSDTLPLREFHLLSTRRSTPVTGSIFLQIGLLPATPTSTLDLSTADALYKDLCERTALHRGSVMGVPAHQGIGTVRRRFRGRKASSSKVPAPTGPKAALAAVLPGSFAAAYVPSTAEEEDEGDEEELKDDGLSSDSSDEEGGVEKVMRRLGIRESSTDVEEEMEIAESNTRQNAEIGMGKVETPPEVVIQESGTEVKEETRRNIFGRKRPVRGDSSASGISITTTDSSIPPPTPGGYFDTPASAVSSKSKKNYLSASTPTTAGSIKSGSQTPSGSGTVTPGSGAVTPGGTKTRRPIFKRGKSRMGTDYNFSSGKDILGIVMLEVQGATDLPKLKNSLRVTFDMDPFVVISFGKRVFRTRVIRHSLNPTWEEKMLFHVRKYEDTFSIQFSLLDWDKISGNDFIGSSAIPLADLVADAPKPHPETGLYDASEDGRHEMKEFKLPVATAKDQGWEAKHSPHLIVKAKYEPYDALRQRFWRQYLVQYDSDDTGTISYTEFETMLDSLASTLTKSTLEGYWTSFGKSPESDELTIDECIICLEGEIKKSREEKNQVELDALASGSQTPAQVNMAPAPAAGGLDVTGPPAPQSPPSVDPDELAAHIKASRPRTDNYPSEGETNVEPIKIEGSEGKIGAAQNLAVGAALPTTTSDHTSSQSSSSDDDTPPEQVDSTERIVNIKSCPLCHRPRLNAKSEGDIITHLAVCASADWNRVDRIVVGNYVTASQAQRKFLSKVLTKVSTGSYALGANSANIIVQDRATGQLQEEKMAVYVRIGIRVLYKGARTQMEGARARKLLTSMSIKQGIKFDSPRSAAEIPAFIEFHKLNMDEVLDPVESFKTFNQFFYRKLKPGARPIAEPNNPKIVVSPADCRMMAFETVNEATRIWIKGREFSVSRLLGDDNKDVAHKFEGGALGIFRLAPQDYHRFHSPLNQGVIGKPSRAGLSLFTVNPQAIRTSLDVYGENIRQVWPIHTAEFGTVMTIWVGAMMVGSIGSSVAEGDHVNAGDELGWFAFGGSTIILLFEKGVMQWDEDLLNNSRSSVETLIRMGNRVGESTGRERSTRPASVHS